MNHNTASNVKTVVCLLHEVLFVGIIGEGIRMNVKLQCRSVLITLEIAG